jgi:type I restriction enzyme S subunit
MEVKPGYKQTEVGVIPEAWEVKPLGEIGEALIGLTYKPTDVRQHGTLVLRSSNIQNDTLAFDDNVFVDAAIPERIRVLNDDVLICVRNGSRDLIGKSALLDDRTKGMTFGAFMAVYRSQIGKLASYLFQSAILKRQINEHLGATINQITNKSINSFRIPVPPPPEQHAIAEALSDVDGLLGGLDRLIAKKRDLKQAAMQQLLTGQTRLPSFHGEWEMKTLFELAARKKELFDDGDWIESEHITTEGIRLIQTGNIGVGSFVEKDDKKYINEASFASLRCKQLKQGDLLVCRLADPAGRACVLGDIGEDRIVTSVDVTIFRPPAELANRQFLSQVFSTSDWFRAVSDRSGGTTHKRISRGALGRLSINLPPLAEQTAIAEVLSEIDGELAVLEQRREKTRSLKQAMMQELLTGRTRLLAAGSATTAEVKP